MGSVFVFFWGFWNVYVYLDIKVYYVRFKICVLIMFVIIWEYVCKMDLLWIVFVIKDFMGFSVSFMISVMIFFVRIMVIVKSYLEDSIIVYVF